MPSGEGILILVRKQMNSTFDAFTNFWYSISHFEEKTGTIRNRFAPTLDPNRQRKEAALGLWGGRCFYDPVLQISFFSSGTRFCWVSFLIKNTPVPSCEGQESMRNRHQVRATRSPFPSHLHRNFSCSKKKKIKIKGGLVILFDWDKCPMIL